MKHDARKLPTKWAPRETGEGGVLRAHLDHFAEMFNPDGPRLTGITPHGYEDNYAQHDDEHAAVNHRLVVVKSSEEFHGVIAGGQSGLERNCQSSIRDAPRERTYQRRSGLSM